MDTCAFQPLYHPPQIQHGERALAQDAGFELFHLMCKAGNAVAQVVLDVFTDHPSVLVVCGGGNNGGDGYIAANALRDAGISVQVISLVDTRQLQGDALRACETWREAGGEVMSVESLTQALSQATLVIDAILGIGAKGALREHIKCAIEHLNQTLLPIISVDVPSGLDAQSGCSLGSTVNAIVTVTFIGVKQGLVTGQAREYVGDLRFESLGVAHQLPLYQTPAAYAVEYSMIQRLMKPRQACAHKGSHGKVLLVGGNQYMSGAIRLATQAALRCGAGLTKVLTHPDSLLATQVSAAEAMVEACDVDAMQAAPEIWRHKLEWANALVLGPGLGMDKWAQNFYSQVSEMDVAKVFDADALNLLALQPSMDPLRILTPHPGEAARLLGVSIVKIEQDRYWAAKALQQQYGGVVVLKGAGTLVYDGKQMFVCLQGNPGMATGGMGDVLAGVIGSLLAQGYPLLEAALFGVVLHSAAADQSAQQDGEIGLLASDVIAQIRHGLNGKWKEM